MKLKKILLALAIFIFSINIANFVLGMSYYENVGTTTGLVTATVLNVRSGPGQIYKIVTTVNKNEYVRVFAKIGTWYVIQTDNDYIGAVSSSYIKLIYPTKGTSENNNTNNNTQNESTNSNGLTQDEQEVFDLVNQERTKAGLKALTIDSNLQKVARVKAQDLVDNNYFAHNSPTYGSPFDMMKNFGITYRAAGENLAGNSNNQKAVTAWMNSEGHRANILSNSYNYTGVAVVSSKTYGKIYVQMFIGR